MRGSRVRQRRRSELANRVLGEPGTQTTRGAFEAANRLTEAIAEWLEVQWAGDPVKGIPLPADRWKPERDPGIVFEGFVPEPLPDNLVAAVIALKTQSGLR